MSNKTEKTQVLILERAGLTLAIPLSLVIRVIPSQEILPVNSRTQVIKGIINFKGKVMPVLSINSRFGV
ncbi:MAG: chemotaxis protein CheW, partial [Bacteroidales bacterium]|nr:chemotaxis protein CheW [Bacteroidales bacterium]